jgi:hypothetical protein
MAAEFGVTPDELRRVSRDLHDESSKMKAVMSTLRAQLAAEGPVWGDDETGRQFADGPNGYLAQLDWVMRSVDAKTDLLDYYSDLLKQAADTFQQADESGMSSAAPGTLAGQSGALSGDGVAGRAPAGATGGTNPTDMAVGGPGLASTRATTEVGPPANAAASPTTATGPSAAAGSRGTGGSPGASDGASAGGPNTSGAPNQDNPAGESSGSSGATPSAAVTGDLPDDAVLAGVDAGDDATMLIDASTPEGTPDTSITSPDTGPFTDASGPTLSDPETPPYPPVLRNAPAPPNARRVAAPDDPSSESPSLARDGQSGLAEPSATTRADAGTQRTGSVRVGGTGVDHAAQDSSGPAGRARSVAKGASAVGRDSIPPEGAARVRRGGSDPSRRSGVTGHEPVAAASSGIVAGHAGGRDDDVRASQPDGDEGLGEGLSTREQSEVHQRPGDTDIVSDGDVDDIVPAASERPQSGREDSAEP